MAIFSKRSLNLAARFVCFQAILCLVFAAGYSGYRWNYLMKAVKAPAQVVDLLEQRNEEGDRLYAPVYVFQPPGGDEVTVTSSRASFPPIANVGETIEILYLPESPQRSIPDDFFSKWGFAVVSGVLGLIEFVIAVAVVRFTGPLLKAQANGNGNGNGAA